MANWGASKETLRLMEEANERGLNITCDQYPYNRGMSPLITTLPPWVHIGGVNKVLERLRNPTIREKIRKELTEGFDGFENWIKDYGWSRIYISTVKTEHNQDILGKNLAEITRIKKKKDEFTAFFDLLLDEEAEITVTLEMMGDEDIRRVMIGRYTMIGTDSWQAAPTGILGFGKPHPRFYGTYPRVLGKYVREERLLTLEDAIRKMTYFVAQRLGLKERGLLLEGLWSDIVVLDPKTVIDKATFENPHQFPEGIKHVLVNGELVVENEQQTQKVPGMILHHAPCSITS
jgi:N-acyl-D-amino-acid deacylase